jgi:predicted Zn-dependent peptidase
MLLHNENITDSVKLSVLNTNKFKASVISFTIILPLTKKNYINNLLLAHILRRGTKSYPSTASLNKKLDELYGSYVETKSHRIGENISLTLTAEILDNKFVTDKTDVLGETIDIISELILSPIFLDDSLNTSFFEQEKKLICEAIDAEINNTRLYATKRCLEIINESLDVPTSRECKELIASTTLDSLAEYHDYLINNGAINVFYIGSQDASSIRNKLSSVFTSYPCKKAIPLIFPRPISRADAIEISEKMPVSQGKLVLGLSTGATVSKTDGATYTGVMLNEILGGSASSKLFLNLREKLSLCYHCSSSYSGYSGILVISSGFEVKNYEIAKKEIFNQIEDIKRGNISDTEFEAARLSLTNNYRQIYDSPFELKSFFNNRALLGISENVEDAISKILSVTKEDIIALASNIKLIASYFIEGTLTDDYTEDEDE